MDIVVLFVEKRSDNIKDKLEKELKKKFPPEFINRIDEVVGSHPLDAFGFPRGQSVSGDWRHRGKLGSANHLRRSGQEDDGVLHHSPEGPDQHVLRLHR